MDNPDQYDLGIIGAGPAGYTGALRAAAQGRKVALVEKDRPGGTCLNRGCIPTKALRQCADALLAARTGARFGVVASPPEFDYRLAARHRDQARDSLVAGVESLLKARKVALLKGQARLTGPGRIRVESGGQAREIKCGQIVIATGSIPADLPGLRIDHERVLSSEDALGLEALPESVIVIGAGVIGCEFADLLAAFGVKVQVVELLPRILPGEDRAAAKAAQKALEAKGVEFFVESTVSELDYPDRGVRVALSSGRELRAEQMIVSVGRRPSLDGLDLEAAGVETDRGRIRTDARGRTSGEGVWAAGDVIGPPMLAHAAVHEMEVVIENLLGGRREFEREVIPSVVFIRPELASVGLGEDAAKERGVPVSIGRFAYAASGKALCLGEPEGWAKVIAAKEDGTVLGGTILGAHAGELIHELALAVKSRLKVKDLAELVHAHPTLSEVVMEAAADCEGKSVHRLKVR